MKILEYLKIMNKNDGHLCGKRSTSHKTTACLKSMGNVFGFVFLGEVVSCHSILLFGFHIKEMKPGFIMSPSLKTFVALKQHAILVTEVKNTFADISAPLLANEKPSRPKFSCIRNLHNLLDTWCPTPVSAVITLIATCRYSLCWTQQFYFVTLSRGI